MSDICNECDQCVPPDPHAHWCERGLAEERQYVEQLHTRLAALETERDALRDLAASEFARLCKMAADKEDLRTRLAELEAERASVLRTIDAEDHPAAFDELVGSRVWADGERIATLEAALSEWGNWLVEHGDSGLSVPTNATAVAIECALAASQKGATDGGS